MSFSEVKRDYWPTEEWRTAAPESVGLDRGKLLELDKELNSRCWGVNGMVVVSKGYVVFERYNGGFGPGDSHNVASVTKSVISALIGIAIDLGYVESVNQNVLDFFPDYVPAKNDFLKRTVTIKDLLTMTAPFAWKTRNLRDEPLDKLLRQRDWVAFVLDLLDRDGQPGEFQYSTAGPHLLSAIISGATGKCAREFANEYLFRPVGMREIPDRSMESFELDDVFGKNVKGWIKDPNGISTGGWGLTLTPWDMARFGFLYLNGGSWNDKQIISKEWIDESTAMNPNGYGYLWWLGEENDIFSFSALGAGGNVIRCIPEKDLVVAIASEIVDKPRDPMQLVDDCILPAVQ